MKREDIKQHILDYIECNIIGNGYEFEDQLDIILDILYNLEDYTNYENKNISKAIDLLQELI